MAHGLPRPAGQRLAYANAVQIGYPHMVAMAE